MDWIIIAIAFMVFWPLGVFLLFGKLNGKKNTKSASRSSQGSYHQEYEYHYQNQELKQWQQSGQNKTAQKKTAQSKTAQPRENARTAGGRKMTAGGAAMAAVFGAVSVSKLLEYLSWGGLSYAWSELFWLFGLCAAGLTVMSVGLLRTRQGKRFQKYLGLIGKRRQVPVATLAGAAGVSLKKAYDDLEDMLEQGLLPVGYLDRSRGLLVLSEEGVQDAPVKEKKDPNEAGQTNAILREIREINDEIADPDMSAKIARIEDITGKILDYQKKNPGRDSELRSFLDYYLPTTLKILRSYAQLEAQGVEGENIRSAKARIEGMMDKVVEGFEKQLDQLFQSDTMDITSDVEVLEQMLKKDGLSENGGMTL